jgi:hypothetical protein
MTALRCPSGAETTPGHAQAGRAPLAAADRRLLRLLRAVARQAQLSGPIAVDHVCSLTEPADPVAYGLALMRTLDAVASRPMLFHPVGAEEVGFDEMWLVRLVRCLQGGDTASARLLIDRRTERMGRRAVAFLAQGLALRLDPAGLDETSLETF